MSESRLRAVGLPGGPAFVDALQRAWDDGDAVLPVDRRLPIPARERLLATTRPAVWIDEHGSRPLDGGDPVEPGDALVVATSGTTGDPKGVVLTHDAVRASARITSAALGVDDDDRWLACLPHAHIGGLSVITRALITGTGLEVHDGFRASLVARSGATLVSLVPAVLDRIDASRFRWILLGGSAIPADRPPNSVATYGMTETGSGIVYDGRPLDGVELRVTDDQIEVRSPTLLRSYRDGTVPLEDGWFATGDAGEILADGTLRVHGRIGDLIVTGGEKVWPVAVEQVLATAPGVAAVQIVGEPDPTWGAVVTARVVPVDPASPPSLDRLRGVVEETLAPYCAPRRLELVEHLATTTLGKMKR